jgi:hypothetical protein
MNKRTAIKATITLLIMFSISAGVCFLLMNYQEIAGYIGIGLFVVLMWMMTYNVIENREKK